jgi:hypothetical protein
MAQAVHHSRASEEETVNDLRMLRAVLNGVCNSKVLRSLRELCEQRRSEDRSIRDPLPQPFRPFSFSPWCKTSISVKSYLAATRTGSFLTVPPTRLPTVPTITRHVIIRGW